MIHRPPFGAGFFMEYHMNDSISQFDVLKNVGGYLQADGFEDALIGFVWPKNTGKKTAVYDWGECIEVLKKDGMTEEDAIEFFEYNVSGAYVGEQTPYYVNRD
jgi:hypothetical protein